MSSGCWPPEATGVIASLPVLPEERRKSRYEQGVNFAAVLRESRGEGYELPPPPEFELPPADLAEAVRRALYEVPDPEFPISILDLGLVCGVEVDDATGLVRVAVTFTSTACPCMDFIEWDVRERLLAEPGVSRVEIEAVWDPPWTTERISERGRGILRDCGVAI